MPRAKTTARHASCKITAGSALDRLTQGRSFTEVVHQIAEMYERACAVSAVGIMGGDTPVEGATGWEADMQFKAAPDGGGVSYPRYEQPAAPQEQFGDTEERSTVSFGGNSRDTHREPEEHQRRVQGQKLFSVPDPETGVYVTVNETEALRLLKQQCPAGLEPVLDEFMIAVENGDLAETGFDNGEVVEPDPQDFDYAVLA